MCGARMSHDVVWRNYIQKFPDPFVVSHRVNKFILRLFRTSFRIQTSVMLCCCVFSFCALSHICYYFCVSSFAICRSLKYNFPFFGFVFILSSWNSNQRIQKCQPSTSQHQILRVPLWSTVNSRRSNSHSTKANTSFSSSIHWTCKCYDNFVLDINFTLAFVWKANSCWKDTHYLIQRLQIGYSF